VVKTEFSRKSAMIEGEIVIGSGEVRREDAQKKKQVILENIYYYQGLELSSLKYKRKKRKGRRREVGVGTTRTEKRTTPKQGQGRKGRTDGREST